MIFQNSKILPAFTAHPTCPIRKSLAIGGTEKVTSDYMTLHYINGAKEVSFSIDGHSLTERHITMRLTASTSRHHLHMSSSSKPHLSSHFWQRRLSASPDPIIPGKRGGKSKRKGWQRGGRRGLLGFAQQRPSPQKVSIETETSMKDCSCSQRFHWQPTGLLTEF